MTSPPKRIERSTNRRFSMPCNRSSWPTRIQAGPDKRMTATPEGSPPDDSATIVSPSRTA